MGVVHVLVEYVLLYTGSKVIKSEAMNAKPHSFATDRICDK